MANVQALCEAGHLEICRFTFALQSISGLKPKDSSSAQVLQSHSSGSQSKKNPLRLARRSHEKEKLLESIPLQIFYRFVSSNLFNTVLN
jgi:hypothetical protein